MDLQRFQHEIEALLTEINDETSGCIPATLCRQFLEITKCFSEENEKNFEELSAGLEFSLRTYIPFRRKCAEIQNEADELGRFIFMQCARLVLGVEFQRLGEEDAPKVTLKRTIGEAYTQLQPFPMVGHLFLVLPWLMVNSWSHPTLVAMMGGDDIDEETAFTYLKSGEYPEIFRLRIEMLIEGGVDAFALNLCNWCAKSDTFKEDLSIRKSQFSLMHRLEKRSEFLTECCHMNCCVGVNIIEDFKEDSEFQNAGLMMAQSLLIQDLTKQSKHCCTKVLMKSWLTLERSEEPDDKEFLDSVSKVSNLITNTEQLIAFSAVMIDLFNSSYLEFCTELLLKAIKTERYKLDSARVMKNENESNVAADCLGKLCFQIVCLYQDHTSMYLSSLLTTIYLDPSVEIYSRLQKIMTDQPELAEDVEDIEDLSSPDGIDNDLYHDAFENVETLRPGTFHIKEGWEELKKTIFYHMEQCGYRYDESENVFTTDSDSDAETIDYPLQEEPETDSTEEEDLDEDQATSDEPNSEKDLQILQDQMETSPSNDIEDPGGGTERNLICVVGEEDNDSKVDGTEIGSNSEQESCKANEIIEEQEDSQNTHASMEIDEEESSEDIQNASINSQATISDFQRQFMNFTQSTRFEDETSEEESNQESGSPKPEKESKEEETNEDKKMSSTHLEDKEETKNTSLEIIDDKNKRNEQLNKIETANDEADILRLKLDRTLSSVLEKRSVKPKIANESTMEDKVIPASSEDLESSKDKQIMHQDSDSEKKEIELQTEGIERDHEGNDDKDTTAICDEENSNNAAEEKEVDTDPSNENMLSDVDENIGITTEKVRKSHEYMCNYCGKVFNTKVKRRRHQEWICTKKDFFESKSMACEICGKNFNTDISLKRHYTQFHRVAEPVKNIFDGVKLPQGVNCNVANCEVTLSPLNTDVVAKYESQPVVPKRGRGRPRKVELQPAPPTSLKKKGHSSKNKDHKRSIRTRDSSGFYKEWSDSESNDEETSSINADDTGDAVSSQEEDQESTHSSTYECKHCDLTFTNYEDSDKHKTLCSLAVDLLGLVTCNDCGANFEGKKSLREHVIVCERGRKKYETSQVEDSQKMKVESIENTTGSTLVGNETQGNTSFSEKDEKSNTSLEIKFVVDYFKPALHIEDVFLMYKYASAGRCPACAKIFETGNECKVHQKKECIPERGVKIIVGFQCVVCKNNFLTPKICRAHMQKECNSKTILSEKSKCKLCSKLFSSPQNYLAHLSQVHKNSSTPSKDCFQNSGEKTTVTTGDKDVNEITQYSCSKCVLRFYDYKDINKHCDTVCKGADIITVKRVECCNCMGLFEDVSQLSDHLLLCQGLNRLSLDENGCVIYGGIRYCCSICKASFLQRRYVFDHLNRRHQEIEIIDRPGYVIEQKDATPLHELFKCKICGRNFPYNMSALRHIRCNHPEIAENNRSANVSVVKANSTSLGNNENKPEKKKKMFSYKCSLCGKVLSSKFLVKKHITRLHLELGVEDMDKNIEKVDRVEQIKPNEKQKTDNQTKTPTSTKKICRKMWRCKLCKKEYPEYDTLLVHLGKDHTAEEKQSYFNAMKKDSQNNSLSPVTKYYFRCKVCNTKLSSRGLAKEHITMNHPQVNPQEMEQMILYVPPEQGTTEIKDIANQPTQTVPQAAVPSKNCLFHCNICRTNFTSLHWVTDHISLQHPQIPKDLINKYITGTEEHIVNYSCRCCAAVYGQKETALDHVRHSHQSLIMGKPVEEFIQVCNIIDQYQCRVCGEKLKTLDAGKVHLSTQHNLIVIGIEQCRKFITPMNPPSKVEAPKTKEKAEEDMSNHLFALEVKKALQYRVKKDPNKVPMRYTCQVCQKEFIQLYYAKLHLRVKHSDLPLESRGSYISQQPLEKIFKCTVCGLTFKDQAVAMSHLQDIHQGNDPAKQTPEACITIEYDTKKNKAKAYNTRKIFCDLCGTTFDKMASAKSHFTNSHQNIVVTDWKPRKAVCLECKREFDSWEDGETHVHSEHANVLEFNIENALALILEKEAKKIPPKKRYQCKHCRLKMTGQAIARKHYEEKHQKSQIGSVITDQNIAVAEGTQSTEAHDMGNVAQVEIFLIGKHFNVVKKSFSCNVCKIKGYSKAFITRHRSKKHNISCVLSNEVHICGLCYKVFTKERSWTAHMRLSHKDVDRVLLEQNKNRYHKKYSFKFNFLYKCAVCDQQFKDLDVIRYHLATSHSEISHRLIDSNREKYIIDLIPGEKTQHYGCRLCKQLFANIQFAQQHLINHHRDQCLKGHGDLITTVDRLEIEEENTQNVKYFCKLCQKHFQDTREAQSHIVDVHNITHLNDGIQNNVLLVEISQEKENSDQTKNEKSFCCNLCGDSFQDIQKAERHVMKCHTDVKKEAVLGNVMKKKAFMKLAIGFIFVCKACNYNFEGNKAQVRQHIAEIHPEIKEESMLENIRKISLLKKVPKHFGGVNEVKKKIHKMKLTKRFECMICQYKAGTKYTLRKHVKIRHTHVSYDDINEHIKRHVSQQKKEIKSVSGHFFKCKICGLKFIFKQSARSHIKKRHSDIPFEEINKNISRESNIPEKSNKKVSKEVHIPEVVNKNISRESNIPEKSNKKVSKEVHIPEVVNKNIFTESSSPKRPKKIVQLVRICKICDWKTTERSRGKKHVKTNHPEISEENFEICFEKIHKKLVYRCKQCTQVLQTEREIYVHITGQHGLTDSTQMLQMIEQLYISLSGSETAEQNKQVSTSSKTDLNKDVNIPNETVEVNSEDKNKEKSHDGVIKMSPYDLQNDSVRRKEEFGKAIVGKVLDSELSHLKSMAGIPSTSTYQQNYINIQPTSATTSYEVAFPNPGLLADITSKISCYTIDSSQYTNTKFEGAEETVSESSSSVEQNFQAGSSERTVLPKATLAGKALEAGPNKQANKNVHTLEQSILENENANVSKSSSLKVENVSTSENNSNVDIVHGSAVSSSVAATKSGSTDTKRDTLESKIGDLLEYYTRVNKNQREDLSSLKTGKGGRYSTAARQSQKDTSTSVGQTSSRSPQLILPNNHGVPSTQMVTSTTVAGLSACQQFVPQSTIVTHDLQTTQMPSYTVPSYIGMAAPPNVTLLPNSQTILGQSSEVLNICGTQNIYVQNQQETDIGQADMLVAPGIVLQQQTQQASPLQLQQNAAGNYELIVPAQQQSPFQLHQDAAVNLGVVIPAQQLHQDSEGNLVMQTQHENTAIQLQQTSVGNMLYSNSQPQVLSYSLSPHSMQGGGILLAQQNISSNNLPQNVMASRIENRTVRLPQCMSVPKPVTTPIQSSLNLSHSNNSGIVRSDQNQSKTKIVGATTTRPVSSGQLNTSLNSPLQPAGSLMGVNRMSSHNNLTSMPLSAGGNVRNHQQIRPKAPLSVPQPQVIMSSRQSLQNKLNLTMLGHRPIAHQQRLPATVLETKKTPVVITSNNVIAMSNLSAKKGESTSNGQKLAADRGSSNKPATGSTPIRLSEVVSKRFLSGPTRLDCSSCGEIFLDEKSLDTHIGSKCTVCKPCKISFANRKLMDEHLKVVHTQTEQGTKQKHANIINIAPVNKAIKSKATKEGRIIPNKEVLHIQKTVNIPQIQKTVKVPQKEATSQVPMKSLLSVSTSGLPNVALNADYSHQETAVSQNQHHDVLKNSSVATVVSDIKKGAEENESLKQDQEKSQEIHQGFSTTCPVHKDEKKHIGTESQETKPETEMDFIVKMTSPAVTDIAKSETLKEIEGSVISVKVPPIEELVKITYQVESHTLSVSKAEPETKNECVIPEHNNILNQTESNKFQEEVTENDIGKVTFETDIVIENQKIQREVLEKSQEDTNQELCKENVKDEEGSPNKWIHVADLTQDEIIDVDSVSNTVVIDVTNVSPQIKPNMLELEMKEEGQLNLQEEVIVENKIDFDICGGIEDVSKVEEIESKTPVSQTFEETNVGTTDAGRIIEGDKIYSQEMDSGPDKQNHSSVMAECDSNPAIDQDEIVDEYLKCQHCAVNICFKNGEDLKQHMKLVHGDPNSDESNFSMVCAICRDQSIYVTELDFKCHMKWMHHVNWVKPKQLGRTGSTESESSSNESQTEVKQEKDIVKPKRGRPRKEANSSKVTAKNLSKKQGVLRATPERLSNRAIEKLTQKDETKEKSEKEPSLLKRHSVNKPISPRKIIEVGSGSGKKWGMRNLAARRAGRAAANLLQKSKTSARMKALSNAGFPKAEMYTQRQLAYLRNQTTTDTYNQVGAVTGKTETDNKVNSKNENLTKGQDINDKETVGSTRRARKNSCLGQEDGLTRRSTRLSTSPSKDVIHNSSKRQTRLSSPKKEKSKDVKEKSKDGKEKSRDVKEKSKDVTEKSKDGKEKSKDVKEKSKDGKEKSKDGKEKSRDVKEKSKDVTEKSKDMKKKVAVQCPWNKYERTSKAEATKRGVNKPTTPIVKPGQGKYRKLGRPRKSPSKEIKKSGSKEVKIGVHISRSTNKGELIKRYNTLTNKDTKLMKNSEGKQQIVKKGERASSSSSPSRKKQSNKVDDKSNSVNLDKNTNNGAPDNPILTDGEDKFTKRVVPSGPRDIAARLKSMKQRKRSIKAERKETIDQAENLNSKVNSDKESKSGVPNLVENLSPDLNCAKEKQNVRERKRNVSNPSTQYVWRCAVCSKSFNYHNLWEKHYKTHSEEEIKIQDGLGKECGHHRRQACNCFKQDEISPHREIFDQMVKRKLEESLQASPANNQMKKGIMGIDSTPQPANELVTPNISPSGKDITESHCNKEKISVSKKSPSNEKTAVPGGSPRKEKTTLSGNSPSINKITVPEDSSSKENTTLPAEPPSKEKKTLTRGSPSKEKTTPPRGSPSKEKTSVPSGSPSKEKTALPRGSPSKEKTSVPSGSPSKEKTALPRGSPSKGKVLQLQSKTGKGKSTHPDSQTRVEKSSLTKIQPSKGKESQPKKVPILSGSQSKKNTPNQRSLSNATSSKIQASKTMPHENKSKNVSPAKDSVPVKVSKPTKTRSRSASVTYQKPSRKKVATLSLPLQPKQTAVKSSESKNKLSAKEPTNQEDVGKSEQLKINEGTSEQNPEDKTLQTTEAFEQKETVYCSSDEEVSFSATPSWKKSNSSFDDTWTKRSDILSPPIKTYKRQKVKRRSSGDSDSNEELKKRENTAEPLQKEEKSPTSMYDGIKNRKRARSNSTDSNVSVQSHSLSKTDTAGKTPAGNENKNTGKSNVGDVKRLSKESAKRARSCSPETKSPCQRSRESEKSSPLKQNGSPESTTKDCSNKSNVDNSENRRFPRSRTLSSSSNVSDVSASSSKSRTSSRTSERNLLSTLNETGREKEQGAGVKEKPKTRHQMAEEAKNNNLVLRNARQVSKKKERGRWIQAPAGVIKTPISPKTQMLRRQNIKIVKTSNKRKATATPQTPPHSAKRKK